MSEPAQIDIEQAIAAKVEVFLDGKVELRKGDCRDVLRAMPDNSIDSVVTDPPYALVSIVKRFGGEPVSNMHTQAAEQPPNRGAQYKRLSKGFMGKTWDTGETAFATEFWAEVLRVLKPGGHVVAFSGTRTYHRMACAIEDAGFEIRDQLQWLYGSGFPKSHDVSKGIDKAAGAEREVVVARTINNNRFATSGSGTEQEHFRKFEGNASITAPSTDAAKQWEGWGSALKPACEPICLARKPLIGTIVQNVLTHGTGAINIDGCRVETNGEDRAARYAGQSPGGSFGSNGIYGEMDKQTAWDAPVGRFPANVIHDGSPEVVAGFPDAPGQQRPTLGTEQSHTGDDNTVCYGTYARVPSGPIRGDSGSAARFFYTAKADADDRLGSDHPTVKPVSLMRYLAKLITPPGGIVLDPFAGTGTTGEAAYLEGFRAILIEREVEYQRDIARRMDLVVNPSKREAVAKTKGDIDRPAHDLPLFAGLKNGG